MELNKKKYKRIEVEDIINSLIAEYTEKLADKDEQISNLKSNNIILNEKLDKYVENDMLISNTLKHAQAKAQEIIDNAQKQNKLEEEKIKNFSIRWKDYFDYLFEKYPNYEIVKESKEISEKLCQALSSLKSENTNKTTEEMVKKSNIFNPKQRIQDYLKTTSESGFDMQQVLYPGELDLEDICKELGLTESE